jgi:hypothetical protein
MKPFSAGRATISATTFSSTTASASCELRVVSCIGTSTLLLSRWI